MATSKQYKVYLTPRTGEFTYGTEVQVSAEILNTGIKTMKRTIDSSDYEIGVYTYGDINIKMVNKNGKYNNEWDRRSFFKYSRDLAKIRVDYSDNNGDVTRFKGLINEEGTRQNIEKEEITFKVLSQDSVMRTTKVAAGLIPNAVLASAAIKSILNQAKVLSVLNYSASNINVDQDFTIDDGTKFDNVVVRKALNSLLAASNSVLVIDSSDNVIVQGRDASTASVFSLYGPYDEKNRQNIHGVKKYNTGRHRTFTSVKIGDTESTNNGYSLDYGYRQKKFAMEFVTNNATQATIGAKILDEFKDPRVELEVACPTHIVKNVNLLDPISLNYPLRVKRITGKFLPVVGATVIGDAEMPLPNTYGNAAIPSNMAFKVIEIAENAGKFETVLKLRQYGWFNDPASCYVGYAKIDESTICETGTACDAFEVAFIGGGKINCTLVT